MLNSALLFFPTSADTRNMDTSIITALSQALDLGSARVQAISNNISNINTPGYKRQDATFAALLDAASNENSGEVTETVTDPRHLTLDDAPGSTPTITTQHNGQMRHDGNNVDIDAETSRLAGAEIYYQGASQLLSGQFASLKYVIAGGK